MPSVPSELIDERLVGAGRSALVEARSVIDAVSRRFGFEEDECYALKMAVNEAVTNAVEHGALDDGEVLVRVARENARLSVEVADPGTFTPGFPVEDALPPRGRGITLMVQLVDEVCVRATGDGTRVRLSKCLDAAA